MEMPNGKLYSVQLNIANAADGRYILYDINKISELGIDSMLVDEKSTASQNSKFAENSLPQNSEKSSEKRQYSLSDSDNSPKDVFGFTVKQDAKVNEDLLEELSIWHPDAQVDSDGNVTVYHRTSKENADKIRKTGVMTALEDALFFSSKSEGYVSDYGDTVLAFKIPSTVLRVNDIFDGEVHFDVPLKRINNQWSLNVSKYLVDENSNNTQYSLSEDVDTEQFLFDDDFYSIYENEDKSIINQSEAELQAELRAIDDNYTNDDFERRFSVKTKLQAVKNGYQSEYDYIVGEAKKRKLEDYKSNPRKYERLYAEHIRKAEKRKQLAKEVEEATPLKREQYNIIQEYNPAPDSNLVWIRSPKDIKTFAEVINDKDSFVWGDYSKEDAIRDLKRNKVVVYSSYPIKQGVFVSTSFVQAQDYAGGDGSKVYSKEVPLDAVAWINGDEGQYAKVPKSKYYLSKEGEQPTKNGRFYGKDMMLDLPIRQDIQKKSYKTLDDDTPNKKDIKPKKPIADGEIAPPVKSSKKKGDIEQPIAKILTEKPDVKKKSKLWSKIKTNFIDKASPFETLALKTGNREVDAKFNSIRYSDSKAQTLIGEGADGVKSLNDIRTEVEQDGLTEALYDYLYHKHNVDRMSLENREAPNLERLTEEIEKLELGGLKEEQLVAISKERITKETTKKRADLINTVREYLKSKSVKNKPVFGNSMTAELSQKIVDKYEFENPKLVEYANDIYTYNKYLRNLLVEGGVISQETADLWEEMYPHYVPVRRIDSSGLNVNVPLDSRKTGINAPIKRAKGGNTDILPLFDTMAQRTLQTYKAVAKNRFGIELKNTLDSTVEKSETNLDEIIESIDTQDDLLKEGKYGKNPTFTVFENGEKVTFEITDEMYDAMKPTSEGLAYTNKVANTISNSMRGVLTEYNPTFK